MQMTLMDIFSLIGHIRWIPYGIRTRLIRFFYNPGDCLNYPFKKDFFGKTYTGNLNSYIDWNVFFFGAYEFENLLLIKNTLLKDIEGSIIIDIGANVGHHSLFFSTFAKSVYAFEPSPIFYSLIVEKIRFNKLENLHVYNLGLSNYKEKLLYYAPEENHSNKGTGSFIADYNIGITPSEFLQLENGDDFFTHLDLPYISLIKIDVEGFEKKVLLGLEKTLAKYYPIIFMEFSKRTALEIGSLKNLNTLLDNKYIIKAIDNSGKICPFYYDKSFGDIICLPK